MSQEKGRILKDAQAGDPVALARALIATPSVNPEIEESGAGEAAVAELTAGWLRAWGLSEEGGIHLTLLTTTGWGCRPGSDRRERRPCRRPVGRGDRKVGRELEMFAG